MSLFEQNGTILLSCAKGVAPFLKEELAALGYPAVAERDTGIETEGNVSDAMKLNIHLRTAQRVLYELKAFEARTPDELYATLMRMPWEDWIPADGYVTIASFVRTASIRDTRFPNMKCKDAIVDRIRQKCGRRPDTGNERNGVVVFLYWNDSDCRVYLDTSGESLSKRGYRKIPLQAPMQESLAAAVILATGWVGNGNFINPMCGSGTLAIEAALIGLNRAPGLLRSQYALMNLIGFEEEKWKAMRAEARRIPKTSMTGKIIATDISAQAIEAAKQNAKTAGVDHLIEFGLCDFAETPVPEGGGVVIINPEYGERMGADKALEDMYFRIGDFFKQRCQGYTGYVFTGNMELGKKVGLRTCRKIQFFNGPIECRLLAFKLYEGTVRKSKLGGVN